VWLLFVVLPTLGFASKWDKDDVRTSIGVYHIVCAALMASHVVTFGVQMTRLQMRRTLLPVRHVVCSLLSGISALASIRFALITTGAVPEPRATEGKAGGGYAVLLYAILDSVAAFTGDAHREFYSPVDSLWRVAASALRLWGFVVCIVYVVSVSQGQEITADVGRAMVMNEGYDRAPMRMGVTREAAVQRIQPKFTIDDENVSGSDGDEVAIDLENDGISPGDTGDTEES
jgi:hypothetical protein